MSDSVLYKFGASWCGPCRKQEAALKGVKLPVEVKSVDVEEEPELSQKYHVRSVPTLLLVVDDVVKWQANGFTEIDKIQDAVNQYAVA